MSSTPRALVVKATGGAEAPERCAQAFTVSALAVASGADVQLWLTGEATWLAVLGRADAFELPHSPPLVDLLAAVMTGGEVVVCSQCAARRGLAPADLVAGVRIAGAQEFVERVLTPDVQALVY